MELGQLYKITGPDGAPFHGGSGAWPLPHGDEPGAWREIEGDIVPCSNGLHLCRECDLLEWLGPVIWEAEHEGDAVVHDTTKVIVRKARLVRRIGGWNEQAAQLFAADCAERVLPIANDERCDAAVLAARRYAFGLIDGDGLARDARAASAASAARDASAAWAAYAAWAACAAWAAWPASAAWAARAASAAWAARAAWAASAAERKWQEQRLLDYLTARADLDAIRKSVEI